MDEWIYNKLRSRFSHFNDLTALDLGCGEGVNAVGLAKLGAKVTAVDRQSSMIEKTQELARKEKVEVAAKVFKIQDFQLDVQYDIVIFTHVLHFIHDENQKNILQKIIDLVKPGGILIFADLEDDILIPKKCLSLLENSLKNVEVERFSIKDEPHIGADYPHQHKVFYLIGIKK